MNEQNNETFERLYNELEDLLNKKYHLEPTASGVFFHEARVGSSMAKNLRLLRELRNYIVHEKKPDVLDPVVVSDQALRFLEKTIEGLKRPKTAFSVCVPRERILFASLSTPVISLMKSMLERNISHVPVLDSEGIVYGVFSGAMMFAALSAPNPIAITQHTTMRAFDAFLPIHKHFGERYWFVGRNAPLEEVIEHFGATLKDGKKLKMLFVTENGKLGERVLGLITPWDILDDDVVAAQ
jgi:CBS domain-containing protein